MKNIDFTESENIYIYCIFNAKNKIPKMVTLAWNGPAVFFEASKAFNEIWFTKRVYKLIKLNFPVGLTL